VAHRGRSNADDALLAALAWGATADAAAKAAGVSVRTVTRRLADPEFRTKLQEARGDIVRRTAGALTAASQESVRTLLTLQREPTPPAVRLGAARAVLELGLKVGEAAELEERIAQLERQVLGAQGD
jgi:hypothetical protein